MSQHSTAVGTHELSTNDELIKSVITDQAGSLENGWREAFQNGIDAPGATEVRLCYTQDVSVITDDGDGINLSQETGKQLLTVLGNSSKQTGDSQTIGRFGIGAAQVIAKGQTVFASGDTALLFDIDGWGLEARSVPVDALSSYLADYDEKWAATAENHIDQRYVTGTTVLCHHYQAEVPDEDSYRWSTYEERTKNRFKFLESVRETAIYLNGERISANDPSAFERAYKKADAAGEQPLDEGDTMHYAFRRGGRGDIEIFSGGLYVTDIDGRGISGQVTTEPNLDLNFARNEVKSGCPLMKQLRALVDDVRTELLADAENIDSAGREFVATQVIERGDAAFFDTNVFMTATEETVSWNQLTQFDEIPLAETGSRVGDMLEELGGVVLAESDPAVSILRDNIETVPFSLFDAEERAESQNNFVSFETLERSALSPSQDTLLGVARFMVELMDDDRHVEFGRSDKAHGWTDGSTHIVVTETAAPASVAQAWIPELWQTVVHEVSHSNSSQDEPDHGHRFRKKFREVSEGIGMEALSETMEQVEANGVRAVAEAGHDHHNRGRQL
jgi:hypothetical protein